MMLTIVKDVGVESNGRWATIPLTATGLRVVGREQPLLPLTYLTKSERVWMRKMPGRAENPTTKVARAPRCGSSEDSPAIPKAVSLGFGAFRTCAQPAAHPFKISEQQQVKTLTTDQRILLIHQTAKALTMSAPTTKTFGKSTRSVPHPTEKAQKWYPAEDEAKPRKVRGCIHFPRLMLGPARGLGMANWVETGRQYGCGLAGVRKTCPETILGRKHGDAGRRLQMRPRGGWQDLGRTEAAAQRLWSQFDN